MIVSKPVLDIFNKAEFCMNFSLNIIVLCVFLFNTLTIANPDISSINGTSAFISLCFFASNTTQSLGKIQYRSI